MEKIVSRNWFVAAVSILLILAASYPAVTNIFTGRVINRNDDIDICGNMWLISKIQEPEPPGLFYSGMVCYPYGYNIRYTFFNMFPAILFSHIINFSHYAASYNLLIILIFAFNFAAMYLFAKHFIAERLLCAAAGYVFVSVPHIYWGLTMGKLETSLTGFIPLALLFWLRALKADKFIKDCLIAGVLSGFAGLVYHFYFLFILMFIFLYIAGSAAWPGPGRVHIRRKLYASALIIALAAVTMAPLILPSFRIFIDEGLQKKDFNITSHSMRESASSLKIALEFPVRLPAILIAVMAASFFFIRKLGREPAVLLAITILFWILSCGNIIEAPSFFSRFGISGQLKLPLYYMRKIIPFFSRFYWPERFTVITYMTGGVYALNALSRLIGQVRSPGGRSLASAAFILFVFSDIACFSDFYPLGSRKFEIPAFYRALPEGRYAIMHLPFFAASQNQVLYQIWHGKPLADMPFFLGNINSIDEKYLAYIKGSPLFQDLLSFHFNENSGIIRAPRPAAAGELAENNIRYAILHKGFSPQPATNLFMFFNDLNIFRIVNLQDSSYHFNTDHDTKIRKHADYMQLLAGPPVYEDTAVMIYRIAGPQSGE